MDLPHSSTSVFVRRRRALAERLATPAVLAAGLPAMRNYPANTYTFRATSHFLYFVGASIAGGVLLFDRGRCSLFVDPPQPEDALWHGPRPGLDQLQARLGFDSVRPLSGFREAVRDLESVATLPTQDAKSTAWLCAELGRAFRPGQGDVLAPGGPDALLADALIALRLVHDDAALVQLRAAADRSVQAHLTGMRRTRSSSTEQEVCAAMVHELSRHGLVDAYPPIVSTHGEVLHNENHEHELHDGDLVLADVGGEMPEGWAADITRVWPVSGEFSATQRAIYEIVLAAQREAIAMVRPGVRYRDVHRAASKTMLQGLLDLGIFEGQLEGLLERGAAALFFPHGLGHLLGLDVHDMEDLGDRAGYGPGRARSQAFGERFLRLDRDLVPGMLVTIEPGFYQVPAILDDPRFTEPLGSDLRRDVLARFRDVRGVRIEDDVLVTDSDPEVLTQAVPKEPAEIEAVMRS